MAPQSRITQRGRLDGLNPLRTEQGTTKQVGTRLFEKFEGDLHPIEILVVDFRNHILPDVPTFLSISTNAAVA